jgi:GTP 3',8-cyclase
VTVSLDALDDATFRAVADTPCPVAAVLAGIDAAVAAGLAPVKVNTVLQRGVNDDQVEELAGWARDTGVDDPVHRVHGRRHHQRLGT